MSGNHNTMSKTLSVNDKLFNISLRGIKSSAAIIEQNLSSKYELRIDTANTRIISSAIYEYHALLVQNSQANIAPYK